MKVPPTETTTRAPPSSPVTSRPKNDGIGGIAWLASRPDAVSILSWSSLGSLLRTSGCLTSGLSLTLIVSRVLAPRNEV